MLIWIELSQKNKDGTFTIQKIKLTPKQYKEAGNEANKLKDDGLHKKH